MSERNQTERGALYLVATPIGNLDDITYRAVKVLGECDFIAAEDTRVTAKLLSAYGISKPMLTYEQHSIKRSGSEIIRRLSEGKTCALVTDAGTPGISDPGEDIVRLCAENGIKVIPIPGACAAVNALIVSALPTRRFVFEGFLDGKPSEKKKRLEELSYETRTMIFYEAPHRIAATVSLMAEVLGSNRRASFCRELTKLNEEIIRTTLGEAVAMLAESSKGEYVIVISGRDTTENDSFFSEMTVAEHIEYYLSLGLDKMSAIKSTAKDRGVPKNEIYKEFAVKKDRQQ